MEKKDYIRQTEHHNLKVYFKCADMHVSELPEREQKYRKLFIDNEL
jgi:hypothetical protein